MNWLLDSDPSIRWQVYRDLADAPDDIVAAERSRVADEGWGARLLSLQHNGQWAGGACFPGGWFDVTHKEPGQPWTSTLPVLQLLYEMGIDPSSEKVKYAINQVKENCYWEHAGQPFFEGEVEPCINGRVVALGSYFGIDTTPVVDRLLNEQLSDGGWNCDVENGSVVSSFGTTINVLEGLLEYESANGGASECKAARHRAEEYLLERNLMRRKTTGDIINANWLKFSFPVRWKYDVLRALDYFRKANHPSDPRMSEAINLVKSKQQPDGKWLLENTHAGATPFQLEDGDGQPSKWNTLRALRVLSWA